MGVDSAGGDHGAATDILRGADFDEADEMLKMGFIDDVEQILEHTPDERQTALFSATMPKEVLKIARRHLRDPVEVRLDHEHGVEGRVEQPRHHALVEQQ